jgi:hypothetical protein
MASTKAYRSDSCVGPLPGCGSGSFEAEDALQDAEGMFDLGPHTRLCPVLCPLELVHPVLSSGSLARHILCLRSGFLDRLGLAVVAAIAPQPHTLRSSSCSRSISTRESATLAAPPAAAFFFMVAPAPARPPYACSSRASFCPGGQRRPARHAHRPLHRPARTQPRDRPPPRRRLARPPGLPALSL